MALGQSEQTPDPQGGFGIQIRRDDDGTATLVMVHPDGSMESMPLTADEADDIEADLDSAADHVLYQGRRTADGTVVEKADHKGRPLPLDPRLDLRTLAPSGGLDWGYEGHGPAQLALAILADYQDDRFAIRHYEHFTVDVVANLGGDQWFLTDVDLDQWISTVETP